MTASPTTGGRSAAPARVLIAEDEQHLGTILQQFLAARGFDVHLVRDGAQALDRLLDESFDVALLDIVMPELDGLEVLRQRREAADPPEMIIITGNGSVETAISALKLGAYDYLSKPYRMAEIEALVRRAHEKRRLTREHTRLLASRDGPGDASLGMTTQFAPLRSVLSLIEQVAPGDACMLISGEPGTGKARLARLVHRLAGGADAAPSSAPFAMVDCARLRGDALTVELFGAARGTPMGPHGLAARARQAGILESVAGGTLYLAHVEQAPLDVQQRLARVIRSRRVPVGAGDGEPTLPMTARVIASTSLDLASPDGRTRFDSGLIDALTAVRVQLPPLRDRLVDLPLLARELLGELAGAAAPSLSDEAIAVLASQPWPGNVRELRHVLEGAVLHPHEGVLGVTSLRLQRAADRGDAAARRAAEMTMPADVLRDVDGTPLPLDALERQQIVAVLEATEWHQGEAAQQLGVSAKTLYRKIREFGLARPQDVPSRGRRPARGRPVPAEGAAT